MAAESNPGFEEGELLGRPTADALEPRLSTADRAMRLVVAADALMDANVQYLTDVCSYSLDRDPQAEVYWQIVYSLHRQQVLLAARRPYEGAM